MVRFHIDHTNRVYAGRNYPFTITITPIGEINPQELDVYFDELVETMQYQLTSMLTETLGYYDEALVDRIDVTVYAVVHGNMNRMHSQWHPYELTGPPLEAFAQAHQASQRADLTAFSWQFVFAPWSFFQGGARAVAIPKSLEAKVKKGSMDRKSWESHTYLKPNGIAYPITCAAFALIWTQTTPSQRTPNRFHTVLKHAYELQARFGWGDTVSMHELVAYTRLEPQIRIICFVPNLKRYNDECKIQHPDWSNGKTIYIYWDPGVVH